MGRGVCGDVIHWRRSRSSVAATLLQTPDVGYRPDVEVNIPSHSPKTGVLQHSPILYETHSTLRLEFCNEISNTASHCAVDIYIYIYILVVVLGGFSCEMLIPEVAEKIFVLRRNKKYIYLFNDSTSYKSVCHITIFCRWQCKETI